MAAKVQFGVDQLLAGSTNADRLRGRIGMVTSDVAVTTQGRSSRVALLDAGLEIVKLFAPEHGITASAADGAAVDDDLDALTGLPVASLYGQRLSPSHRSLDDLDAILYDIPDVGARFYTYIWTLSHVMETAARVGKALYVLDRPNPVGGELEAVEGPMLDEANLSSFVGRWSIPIRYSLTIGELARLWNAERSLGCDLHVIPCLGWRREMHWPETGLPFVRMSPAMPSYETALFYPGTCLIEGTNLSEGRGTEAPFRMIGAPWVDGAAVAEAMAALRLPGLRVRAVEFVPAAQKHAGQRCRGVTLEATDARALRPVAAGLHLINTLIRLHPRAFSWMPYPTAANEKGYEHFDRLVGRLDVRRALGRGEPEVNAWTAAAGWAERARPHLLYD